MIVLGVTFLTDASAAILRDGELVCAVSEERINRTKLWHGVPHQAIQRVLQIAGISMDDVDLVATHGEAGAAPPSQPFDEAIARIADSSLSDVVKKRQIEGLRSRQEHETRVLGERTPAYLAEIRALGKAMFVTTHHTAHAASAFFAAGWDEGYVLTTDGWGEDASGTLWRCKGVSMEKLGHTHTFDSLGYFYGSVTKALGFIPHRHEGKVLGLAAYCDEPQSYDEIRMMIDYDRERRSFVARPELGMYLPSYENAVLAEFVGQHSREDVAAAAQRSLEEVVCALVEDLGGKRHKLALAGGVFANVKLNQRVRALPEVNEVFVFPNMGDGGLSVGAAYLAHANETGGRPSGLKTMLCGDDPTDAEIRDVLVSSGLKYECYDDIEMQVAELVARGNVVARCKGSMEFGPRALGNRSILYQATEPEVNGWLNDRLGRSEFMPFAPATLFEDANLYYEGLEGGEESAAYMTLTFDCTERMKREAPAAVHVDGTARPQLVSRERYPEFHRILTEYKRRTGLSSVINTSFNMHEEPIVRDAADAVRAFQASNLRYLALGQYLVEADSDVFEAK